MGMHQKSDRRTRGRATISGNVGASYQKGGDIGPSPSKPNVPEEMRAEANRPVTAGVKHRGDRRDTNKAYTGNTKHSARGKTPRVDVSTRKR